MIEIAAKVSIVLVGVIPSPLVADEVRNRAQRDRSLEPIRLRQRPVRHKAAVRPARNSDAVLIDPWIAPQNLVEPADDIRVSLAAPFERYSPLKLAAIASRTPRIGEENSPAVARVNLELVIPVNAVHAGRSAMNREDQR